jgi:iron-sulfur cluster assembly accessory protein
MIRRLFSSLSKPSMKLGKPPMKLTKPSIPVQVTNSAWLKIDDILEKREKHLFFFSASSGGCNGFNYDFSLMKMEEYLDEIEKLKNYTLLENGKSKIFIDPIAEMLLFGTTIDYIEEDWNKGIFENKFIFIPDKNLVTACGCGVSFTPK